VFEGEREGVKDGERERERGRTLTSCLYFQQQTQISHAAPPSSSYTPPPPLPPLFGLSDKWINPPHIWKNQREGGRGCSV